MDLPDLARSRAVLIGNGTYAEHPRIPNLPGAGACVQAMTELLTGPLCGWPAERIAPLVDLAVPSELAVRVVEAVRDAEDVLLVYYVGHGMRTFDGQLALALADTRPHPEALPHTAMLYPSLASILRGARAPTKLVILDCCHAELGHRANYIFQSADLAEAYPVDGLYFIGASARDKKAKAPLDGGLTYFTDAFVTTVTTGIPRQPPTLRLDQIFLELRARLVRANLPEPVEAGTRGAHQYPFARNAAPQELLLDPDAEIARPRPETAEARERAREPQHLHTRQSRTAPDPGTTTSESPATPTLPRRPVPSRRSLLITGAVVAALGIGISTIQTLTANTPTPAAAAALGAPLTGFTGLPDSLAFSPNGHILAAGSSLGSAATILLWNVTDPAHPVSLGPPLAAAADTGLTSINSVAFSPNSHILAAAGDYGDGGSILLWNVTDPAHPVSLGVPLTTTDTGSNATVQSVAFSPNGHILAAGSSGAPVRLWDVTDPAHPTPLGTPLIGFTGDDYSVAFSPDGHTLAAAGDNGDGPNSSSSNYYSGTVQLWDVTNPATPTPLGTPLIGFGNSAGPLAFSPNGHTLAAAGDDGTGNGSDGTIGLWDVTDPSHPVLLSQPLLGFTDKIDSVAFSPSGHTLAAACGDGTLRLWDVTDPKSPDSVGPPLTGFDASVDSVAFSPNGHTLAAGGANIGGAGGDAGILLWALR